MRVATKTKAGAKPFVKWAGGKGQLIAEISGRLPEELGAGEIETYVEPFVGGGAVFFYIAQKYPAIKHFYLFDINDDLVGCYKAIKNDVEAVIDELREFEEKFLPLEDGQRKEMFLGIRKEFNEEKFSSPGIRTSAKLIFLNRTCFNGLYRVNKRGLFNVPFGRYKNPRICNEKNLRQVAEILQKADVLCGDFTESEKYINQKSFVYFDPPYRPLNRTAYFTSYSKDRFTEEDQLELAEFCKKVNSTDAKFLLSNSDPKNEDPTDHFFEDHYKQFTIERVKANRAINCKASGRGPIKELLITNY